MVSFPPFPQRHGFFLGLMMLLYIFHPNISFLSLKQKLDPFVYLKVFYKHNKNNLQCFSVKFSTDLEHTRIDYI